MEYKYGLERFKEAQDGGIYEKALMEIQAGRKRSHWMWYIFPQLQGLGFSPASRFFGIKNLAEARAYLNDKVLGCRLREICSALLDLGSADANAIFGSPDDLKLKSSMTLFDQVSPHDIFEKVLDRFYKGEQDRYSLEILESLEEK